MSKKDKNPSLTGKVLVGKIQGHKDGFGFFIPDDKNYKDFYVHPNNMLGAVHSDRVKAVLKLYGGKYEAEVIKILERGFKEIVGYLKDVGRNRFFVPFSRNIQDWFTIKNLKGCFEYDVVKVRVKEYPALYIKGKAEIIEKIGTLSDQNIDNRIVIEKYQLDRNFPETCDEECNYIESSLFKTDLKNITDFRDLYTVTIDGETAKDFDDAISVEIVNEDELVLYVHIADVSRYVTNNSKLDEEARRRGSSVYFPEFAIPMLPEVLSNGVCSLVPNADRYTVTAKITFNKYGKKINTSFYRSIIRSNRRLTYHHVNEVLAGNVADNDELNEFLKNAKKISDLLLDKRKIDGVIEFELPDPVFKFDGEGNVIDVCPAERGYSERLIECFMIAANESVAEYFHNNKVHGIYRVHNNPDINKLKDWYNIATNFNIELPPFKEDITSKEIAEFSIAASNSEHSDLLNSLLVRSMMRAEYTTENIGHFGLASEAYTHFTSPIRRYPDLLVHRALLSSLKLGQDEVSLDDLTVMASECSILERKAQDAEHDINTFKKLEFLSRNQKDVFEGYINRIVNNGVFVYVEKLMITGFIDLSKHPYMQYLNALKEYEYAFGSKMPEKYRKNVYSHYLGDIENIDDVSLELKVGDKVKLKVSKISVETLQADFTLYDDITNKVKTKSSSKSEKSNKKINDSKKTTSRKTSSKKEPVKTKKVKDINLSNKKLKKEKEAEDFINNKLDSESSKTPSSRKTSKKKEVEIRRLSKSNKTTKRKVETKKATKPKKKSNKPSRKERKNSKKS